MDDAVVDIAVVVVIVSVGLAVADVGMAEAEDGAVAWAEASVIEEWTTEKVVAAVVVVNNSCTAGWVVYMPLLLWVGLE